MILFHFPEFEHMRLLESPKFQPGHFRTRRFHNGELFIELDTEVAGMECGVIGSITPPDSRLLSTLLLSHTLRKERARKITAIIPYLAYSRQDRNKPNQSLAAQWTGALAQASGFDEIITVDVHSIEDQRLSPIPLISLSPAPVFASVLQQYQLMGATIVAPDEGAIARCTAIRDAAGLPPEPIPYFEKHRTDTGIQHTGFVGAVGTQVVLVDDILDTGATLVSACQRLLCAGVEDVEIMVTHGLFTGDEWRGLWELGVSRIFCTDTVPAAAEKPNGRIVTVSAVPLLKKALSGCR
jgi:ribose-phosphate pyrophosphokinase